MPSLARLFGQKEQPAYDYQTEADEFVAHWDRLFQRACDHADATRKTDAALAALAALETIRLKVDAFTAIASQQNL